METCFKVILPESSDFHGVFSLHFSVDQFAVNSVSPFLANASADTTVRHFARRAVVAWPALGSAELSLSLIINFSCLEE